MMRALFLLLLTPTTFIFADLLTIDNETSYPKQRPQTEIAIQWASNSQELNQHTNETLNLKNSTSSTLLQKNGVAELQIPQGKKYFRVVVWTGKNAPPQYVTSWVLIVPNKTYTVKDKDLYDAVLTAGSGC